MKNAAATPTSPRAATSTATAAKTAAAKAAAAKSAAAKSTARSASAKTAAAKTAAAKAAAEKAAAEKAAAEKAATEKAAAEMAAAEQPTHEGTGEEAAADGAAALETVTETPAVDGEGVAIVSATAVADDTAAPMSAGSVGEAASDDPGADTLVAELEPTAESTAVPVPADAVEPVPNPTADALTDGSVVVVDPETSQEPPLRAEGSREDQPSTEAIRIRGLVKQFGDNRAVDGIDLSVPAASFYGIVGPNGAGKTTTLSIVAGLLRADEGSVVICGIDQAVDPLAAKRVMGVLPDRLRTFDRLTGRQLLYYYGLLRGLAADVIEKRAADLARAFDLGDALNRVVSDYSAGMTKKIMLAGAMIHSPRVLVLDEPFESVDPVSSAVILDILRAYVAHGGTVILSSHGMDLVERVCSRVAIIVNGEVLAEGTIDEVRAGQTLESRFVELAGSSGEVEGLEWLHTFSD
ncbi:ATP-binding cassette domain-containing protein [Microbacterium sp. NPDC047426]